MVNFIRPPIFWPEGARLVISLSMQFEAGAQPDRGAQGPFPPLDVTYPDLPMQKRYEYGIKEGIPRLLDLWDEKGIKVTSHMVGQAVERHPEIAREIARWALDRADTLREGQTASHAARRQFVEASRDDVPGGVHHHLEQDRADST